MPEKLAPCGKIDSGKFATLGPVLVCPVRNCHKPLDRQGKSLVCPDGHLFDVSRGGYVNLLQPQDRRSKNPGDTAAAVEARQRLHDRGVTQPLLDGIAEMAAPASLLPSSKDVVLDAGCGDGFYLGHLAGRFGFEAHGIDISAPAIRAAAKRYPGTVSPQSPSRFTWTIANADRFIPYSDASFSLVLSITARMNAPEFRRVLRPGALHQGGRLLVAVASPLDFKELRVATVSGAVTEEIGRDRVPRTIETFARDFKLIAQRRVTTTAELDADAVRDVLLSIYRPLRSQPIEPMLLTFSLDLLLFEPIPFTPASFVPAL